MGAARCKGLVCGIMIHIVAAVMAARCKAAPRNLMHILFTNGRKREGREDYFVPNVKQKETRRQRNDKRRSKAEHEQQ